MADAGKQLADAVVSAVLDTYDRRCPKRKKLATGVEWGVLAAVVCTRADCLYTNVSSQEPPQVLTFATGTKCLGRSKMPRDGSKLLDSHAEIVAVRTFRLYLLREIERFHNGCGSSLLSKGEHGKLRIAPGVALHLYISQTPCGDASIFSTATTAEVSSNTHASLNTAYDTQRTGAKCVAGGPQDSLSAGDGYHEVGALRTKPGRGDPTACMSCSDKIAVWNVVGCQGALVSHFMDPIYLESVIVGELFDEASLQRALNLRIVPIDGLPAPYRVNQVATLRAQKLFISGVHLQTQAWTAIAQQQKTANRSDNEDLVSTNRNEDKNSLTEARRSEDRSAQASHERERNKMNQSDTPKDKTSQSEQVADTSESSTQLPDKNNPSSRKIAATQPTPQQRPLSASSRSMNWAADTKEAEVSVLGIREGAKVKEPVPVKARISLCKQRLLQTFMCTLKASDISLGSECHTYRDYKHSNRTYQEAKRLLILQRFTTWLTNDPIYEAFTLEDVK